MNAPDTRARRHVDRRTIVRAGVWTVPVVTLAAAAPALAATSGTTQGALKFDTLALYGSDYVGGKPTTLTTLVQVENTYDGGGTPVTGLTVLVTYSNGRVDGAAPTSVSGSGWTFGSASKSGGSWIYSFVWTGSLAVYASTPQLTYTVPMKNSSSGNADITAIASAAGVASASGAASTNL